jgi:hypothetical protein
MNLALSISQQPRARKEPLLPLAVRDHLSLLVNFALCFHVLTNCFLRNSFIFKTICVAPCYFAFHFQLSTGDRSIPDQLFYFQSTTNSLALLQTSTPLQSSDYQLFGRKNNIRLCGPRFASCNPSTLQPSTFDSKRIPQRFQNIRPAGYNLTGGHDEHI